MCAHPAHEVNVSRDEGLCAPDFSKLFETPCIIIALLRFLTQHKSNWSEMDGISSLKEFFRI